VLVSQHKIVRETAEHYTKCILDDLIPDFGLYLKEREFSDLERDLQDGIEAAIETLHLEKWSEER
jgi:hypothetical protein